MPAVCRRITCSLAVTQVSPAAAPNTKHTERGVFQQLGVLWHAAGASVRDGRLWEDCAERHWYSVRLSPAADGRANEGLTAPPVCRSNWVKLSLRIFRGDPNRIERPQRAIFTEQALFKWGFCSAAWRWVWDANLRRSSSSYNHFVLTYFCGWNSDWVITWGMRCSCGVLN